MLKNLGLSTKTKDKHRLHKKNVGLRMKSFVVFYKSSKKKTQLKRNHVIDKSSFCYISAKFYTKKMVEPFNNIHSTLFFNSGRK
jgi:hypothetical protein